MGNDDDISRRCRGGLPTKYKLGGRPESLGRFLGETNFHSPRRGLCRSGQELRLFRPRLGQVFFEFVQPPKWQIAFLWQQALCCHFRVHHARYKVQAFHHGQFRQAISYFLHQAAGTEVGRRGFSRGRRRRGECLWPCWPSRHRITGQRGTRRSTRRSKRASSREGPRQKEGWRRKEQTKGEERGSRPAQGIFRCRTRKPAKAFRRGQREDDQTWSRETRWPHGRAGGRRGGNQRPIFLARLFVLTSGRGWDSSVGGPGRTRRRRTSEEEIREEREESKGQRQREEKEERRWGPRRVGSQRTGGFKRRYYAKLAEPTGPESSRDSKGESSEGESREEATSQEGSGSPAGADPYQGSEWKEAEEEELRWKQSRLRRRQEPEEGQEEEKEEEEKLQSGWGRLTDIEFGQQLRSRVKQFERQQEAPGCSIEEEVTEKTGQRLADAATTRTVTIRSRSKSTSSRCREPNYDLRRADGVLFRHLREAAGGECDGSSTRATPYRASDRSPEAGRFGPAGRCARRTFHVSAPERHRWQLGHSSTPGIVAARGRNGGRSRGRARGQTACQASRKTGAGRPVELGQLRKRQRRQRQSQQLARFLWGSKRKRQERCKGKRKAERMEYDGEGGGDSNSGEARGKMRRLEEQQGSLGYPDADPSRALHNTVRVTVADLKSGVGCCTTFQQLGCLLAWFAIRSPSTEMGDYIVEEFSFLWNGKVAKTKLASGNRRGAAFPLREGELCDLVQVFTDLALADVSLQPIVDMWWHKAWAYVAMCSLNHLAGKGGRLAPGRWTRPERTAAGSILAAVQRRSEVSKPHPTSEEGWQKDVGRRRMGYNGEELAVCHELTWDQVVPALPPQEHGGCINCLDWVSPRTREFLVNPERLLKQEQEVELPKMPGRVHIQATDKMRIASELVSRNVCDWIPLSKVYQVRGVHVLNGLFGVAKPTTLDDGRVILRLIMNLTGSNSTQRQLEGGCTTLPSITSWQSIVLDGDQKLVMHQSDMCSAFYLFRLPPQWKPYLAFNVLADGAQIHGEPGVSYALACACIPMGWLNSVGIMQEISENLLTQQGLSMDNQILRGRILPPWMSTVLDEATSRGRSWWHVYLDNYAGGERIEPGESALDAAICHQMAEDAWNAAGVVSSEKKRVKAAACVTELGAEIQGDNRTLGVSTEKLVKTVQDTLWMLSQRSLNRKHVQILAGRWVFILQFRRPAMSYLQKTWQFISGTTKITQAMRMAVKSELLGLISIAPLLHCFMGAEVSRYVICTDASESGGSVEMAKDLTTEGIDFLTASEELEHSRDKGCIPVLLISLFNGIGGAFRCYDILGVEPLGRIAVELDAAANRVTQRRWPGVELVKDVRSVNRAMVQSWSMKYLKVLEIHLWGGWPCVDLSAVKYGRKNLEGPQSSLFWEIPRIRDLLAEEFGASVKIKHVLENVASMDETAAREISDYMGSVPYKLDSVDAVPMRRPRFCWTSECIENKVSGVTVTEGRYWREVHAPAAYPLQQNCLTEGYEWTGGSTGAVFPTCLKSIPRTQPPPRPAGLNKCDRATIQRWKDDQYRYPPYQYGPNFIITTNSTWRLLNAEEKELLLGYGYQHTSLAWSASRSKGDPVGFDDCRHRLLGDSFSIYSFVVLAASCCHQFVPSIAYQHLAKRMGLAPGFRNILRRQVPLAKMLQYGSLHKDPKAFSNGVHLLNRFLLRKTNHTGSDIRVITGDAMASRSFPRQSVASVWWQWEHSFKTVWKQHSHINVLELESILLGLKFQISRLEAVNQRVFQITDSYVGMSVVSKGRSSSKQLSRVLKVIGAHLLAFGLQMILGHVDSADNPSDEGSRASKTETDSRTVLQS